MGFTKRQGSSLTRKRARRTTTWRSPEASISRMHAHAGLGGGGGDADDRATGRALGEGGGSGSERRDRERRGATAERRDRGGGERRGAARGASEARRPRRRDERARGRRRGDHDAHASGERGEAAPDRRRRPFRPGGRRRRRFSARATRVPMTVNRRTVVVLPHSHRAPGGVASGRTRRVRRARADSSARASRPPPGRRAR